MKKLLILVALGAVAGANAQSLYNNATPAGLTLEGLRTGARPAGGSYSEVQAGNTIAGFGVIGPQGIRLGDDFSFAGNDWLVNKVTVWAYRTGATAADYNAGTMEIRSGSETGAIVATGTFGGPAVFTDIYRIFNATPGDTRHVQVMSFNFNAQITAGTYWITWDLDNPSHAGFAPYLAKVGAQTTPGANAKQSISGAWAGILDGGFAQDMPFWIDGQVVPEPATMVALGLGLAAMARRRRK